ncbi:MAG: Mor transcription activator family protein [Thermodesulfobacteriota bacterium]
MPEADEVNNRMDDRYPEILTDLADRAAELLEQEARLPRKEAERIAKKLADRIGHDWAGSQPYVGRGAVIIERDREIYRRFDGNNHRILALEHNLTERQIYNIVSRVRQEEYSRRQIKLFPDMAASG